MAIGANWAEIWKPVWKPVWTQTAAEPPVPGPGPIQGESGGGKTFWPGYIPPRKKKKKEEEQEVVVEIAVEEIKQERIVKYVAVQPAQSSYFCDNTEIMQAVQPLIKLLENNAIRSRIVKQKIEELEEEEDIIAIVKLLQ